MSIVDIDLVVENKKNMSKDSKMGEFFENRLEISYIEDEPRENQGFDIQIEDDSNVSIRIFDTKDIVRRYYEEMM